KLGCLADTLPGSRRLRLFPAQVANGRRGEGNAAVDADFGGAAACSRKQTLLNTDRISNTRCGRQPECEHENEAGAKQQRALHGFLSPLASLAGSSLRVSVDPHLRA